MNPIESDTVIFFSNFWPVNNPKQDEQVEMYKYTGSIMVFMAIK